MSVNYLDFFLIDYFILFNKLTEVFSMDETRYEAKDEEKVLDHAPIIPHARKGKGSFVTIPAAVEKVDATFSAVEFFSCGIVPFWNNKPMKLLLLLPLFVLGACHHLPPTVRSEYHLMDVDDFLISNMYAHPWVLNKDGKVISFDYKVILKNNRSETRTVNTKGSTIQIGLRKIPIACVSSKGESQQFMMKSGETLALICQVRIYREEGMFHISDYRSIIDIPLESQSVKFAYLLRAEDFK